MKEKPIIFSSAMIKAILSGSKTQTRRLITWPKKGWVDYGKFDELVRLLLGGKNLTHFAGHELPYAVGDRLWVRETWRVGAWSGRISQADGGVKDTGLVSIQYRADGQDLCKKWEGKKPEPSEKWCPSIFMPRWASRLSVDVVSVRAERIQDISEEDAEAEGFDSVESFADYWNSLNKKRRKSWSFNPWVWRVEFKRI